MGRDRTVPFVGVFLEFILVFEVFSTRALLMRGDLLAADSTAASNVFVEASVRFPAAAQRNSS